MFIVKFEECKSPEEMMWDQMRLRITHFHRVCVRVNGVEVIQFSLDLRCMLVCDRGRHGTCFHGCLNKENQSLSAFLTFNKGLNGSFSDPA